MRTPRQDPIAEAPWIGTLERKRATSQDGTGISYEVVGRGERIVLLANGLGGRLYAWQPFIDRHWRDYRFITWDYRGLFESDTPQQPNRLAIHHHVEDAVGILREEGAGRRAVLVGWSMGVLVSLDVAARHPELVAGLVLLNGIHGQCFGTGFQPLFPIPSLPKRLHATCEWLRRHPETLDRLRVLTRLSEWPTVAMMALTAGKRSVALRPVLRRYLDDVLGESFENYMRLFQELDAHSVYHLLPDIEAPALVVSGALDILAPSRQSREMAKRMPHAQRIGLWRSSHFSLLERPEVVLPALDRFLERRAEW
ncbi:MAG: alpha/beta fold hydrolase [Polyangiales bacterium]